MTILNLNQLLITIQQNMSKAIKATLRRQVLNRGPLEEQPVTFIVSDEYVYAWLLNNLPPRSRHRR